MSATTLFCEASDGKFADIAKKKTPKTKKGEKSLTKKPPYTADVCHGAVSTELWS